MPPVQTTYNSDLAPAVPGMRANMELADIVTRTVQTAAGLPFGTAVLRGTTDLSCQAVGGGTPYLGITCLDPTVRPFFGIPADHYPQYSTAAVALKGVWWVTAGAAVTATGSAAFYDANGNITPTATGNTAIVNGTFDSTALAGALVKLRLA